jgi:hypothetical protein
MFNLTSCFIFSLTIHFYLHVNCMYSELHIKLRQTRESLKPKKNKKKENPHAKHTAAGGRRRRMGAAAGGSGRRW